MTLQGRIYTISKQGQELDANAKFLSMIQESVDNDVVVIDGRNIAAGSIYANQIHANAITADHLRADAITSDHITAGVITGDKITSGVIRSQDNSMEIDLNNGTINLSKPLVIDSRKVATEEFVETNLADTVQNIEIGGRNLLSTSPNNWEYGWIDHSTGRDSGTSSHIRMKPDNRVQVEGNSDYTISGKERIVVFQYNSEDNFILRDDIGINNLPKVIKTNQNTDYLRVFLFRTSSSWTLEDVELHEFKIEKGNKATDWTPALEDIENAYTAVAEAKANLAETEAKAHADGVVDKEEKRAIQDAKDKLAEAKAHADDKAETAETNAKDYAKKQVDDIEIGGRNYWITPPEEDLRYTVLGHNNYHEKTNFMEISGYGVSGQAGVRLGEQIIIDFRGTHSISNITRLKFKNLEPNQEYTFQYTPSHEGNLGDSRMFRLFEHRYYTSEDDGKHFTTSFTTDDVGVFTTLFFQDNSSIRDMEILFKIDNIKLEKGNKATDWTPAPEDTQLDINKKTYNPVRYIRDWANGSTANARTHWGEIQAIQYSTGENIAKGKPVTSNGTLSNPTRATDGVISTTYANSSAGYVYAQVDLGQVYYDIESILVSHYYVDGRTYYQTKTEVSADGVNWAPVFDSVIEGEYEETSSGKTFPNTQAKAESLFANQETMKRLGDPTSTVTIDGGHITAGQIKSKNNYSWISLENGQFNLGNGGLIYNSSGLTVNGKLSVTNLEGKIPKAQLDSSVQGELAAGADANTTVSANKSKWDSAEANAKGYTDEAIGDIEVGGRNLLVQYTITRGRYLTSTGGHTVSAAWFHTDYIPVTGYTKLITSGYTNLGNAPSVGYYDSNFAFVKGVNNAGASRAKEITIEPGIAYIRFSGEIKDLPTLKIEKGNKATDWTPAPEDVESSIGDVDEKASSAKTKTDAWSWNGTTEIDGNSIRTKTLQAHHINADTLSAITSNIGEITAGVIRSEDDGININLDTGIINLSRPLTINAVPVATEKKLEEATANVGLADKTDILSGTEIYTDKADDSVVHVEVDGKSYQYSEENLFTLDQWNSIPTSEKPRSTNVPYIEISVTPNSLYVATTNNVRNNGGTGTYPVFVFPTSQNASSAVNGVAIDEPREVISGDDGILRVAIQHNESSVVSGSYWIEVKKAPPTPDYPLEIHSLNDFDVVSQKSEGGMIDGVEVGGRNLFILNQSLWESGSILSSEGTNHGGASRARTIDFFPMESNQNYYLSIHSEHNVGIFAYDEDDNYLGFLGSPVWQTQSTILQSPTGTAKFKMIMATKDNVNITLDELENVVVKLEKGTIATDWTPAPEDITESENHPLIDKINLLLSEPLRSVGDVKDSLFKDSDGLWKIERNVGAIVFDGSESWIMQPRSDYEEGQRFMIDVSDSESSNTRSSVKSSHFTSFTGGGDKLNGAFQWGSSIFIYPPASIATTVSQLKSWLTTNNVEFSYFLDSFETEILDQELQDKLNNLRSFEDSNYVYIVINDKPDIISENLKPTLHTAFKGGGWYNRWNTENDFRRQKLEMDEKVDRENLNDYVPVEGYKEEIGEINTSLQSYSSILKQSRDDIYGLYETELDEDGNEVQTDTLVTNEEGEIVNPGVIAEISDLLNRSTVIENNLGDFTSTWAFLDTKIIMGKEGMLVGEYEFQYNPETDEEEPVLISGIMIGSDRIDFVNGNHEEPVAFITGNVLQINHGIFVKTLQVGEHMLETRVGGHTTWQWIDPQNQE